MIGRLIIVASVFLLSLSAFASAKTVSAAEAIKRIEGVYKHRFANSTVQDEHFTSEDILEIVPYDGDKIYFRVHLEFYNGHTCDLVGIAVYEHGKFVFRIQNDLAANSCELIIGQSGKNIVFDDVDGNCRSYSCGARGGYHGAGFPMKARREIKYMKRLKASREYANAVADFAKSANH